MTVSGRSALTIVRGGAASDETSWASQVTDRGMAKEAEPPTIGGRDKYLAALTIPEEEEEEEDPPQ